MTRSSSPTLAHQIPIARLPLGIDLPLRNLTFLRKTISSIAGGEDDLLHNHASRDRVIYRYPLVQYKSIDGRAEVLGIGEDGRLSLENLLGFPDFTSIFSENGLTGCETETVHLHLSDLPDRKYGLRDWVPLNDENLQKYRQTPSIIARATILENCLTGHVLKFCSAIGWLLPPRSLRVELTDLKPVHGRQLHGNKFTEVFDARFSANISLPTGIGLGKGAAHGMGTLFLGQDRP